MVLKKTTIIYLFFIFIVLIISGCSDDSSGNSEINDPADKEPTNNFNEIGFPIVDEEITLSMLAPRVGGASWEEREYFEIMNEKTNIDFDFQMVPRSDLDEKKSLILGSGDVPDIIYASNLSYQEIDSYGKQGVFLPLEGLIEKYGPNINEMLEEYPDLEKAITSSDGHIYSLPNLTPGNPWSSQPLYYNGSWLEELGVDELPETTDELFDLLMRFKNEDPNGDGKDVIPLTATGISDIRAYVLGAFGHEAQDDSGIEIIDGEVKFTPIQPEYKDYLSYMNKLWENDLLDHEVFSQEDDQKIAKLKNNQVGLFGDWLPVNLPGGDATFEQNPIAPP